jgi:hypothetical protein
MCPQERPDILQNKDLMEVVSAGLSEHIWEQNLTANRVRWAVRRSLRIESYSQSRPLGCPDILENKNLLPLVSGHGFWMSEHYRNKLSSESLMNDLNPKFFNKQVTFCHMNIANIKNQQT